MRVRLAIIAALALGLVSCGSQVVVPTATPVELLTGVDSCYAGGEGGGEDVLEPDPVYGTRFGGRPVMWPNGYRAFRLDSGEVVVVNASGVRVATTGRRYFISIAPVAGDKYALMEAIHAYPAAAGCPYPQDFIER